MTITALIIFRIIDRKLLRKLKLPCYTYSRPEAKCTVKKKVKWLVPIPSQLIVVSKVFCISQVLPTLGYCCYCYFLPSESKERVSSRYY